MADTLICDDEDLTIFTKKYRLRNIFNLYAKNVISIKGVLYSRSGFSEFFISKKKTLYIVLIDLDLIYDNFCQILFTGFR